MSVELLTLEGWKLVLASATGPSADTSIDAGAAADISLTVSSHPAILKEILAVKSITGVPDGLAIARISPTTSSVTIRLLNTTASAISVTANSITATLLAKAA